MSYLTITTDGTIQKRPGVPSYDDLTAAVGGWIEAVAITEGVTMWVNEEGKLQDLDLNPVATAVAHGAIQTADWIAGPAVITGTTPEGDERELTDDEVRIVAARSVR